MPFLHFRPRRSAGSPVAQRSPFGERSTVAASLPGVKRTSAAGRTPATGQTLGAERLPAGEQSSAARWQRALYVPLTILAWLAVVIIFGWLLGHVAHTAVMIVLATILTIALQPLVALF
jgi:hypothetical protein